MSLSHLSDRDTLPGLVLTLTALSGDTMTNTPKYTAKRRLQLHRMGEALAAMFNADVSVYLWEKPPLFSLTPPDDMPLIVQPTYYSSREIKELLGMEVTKIRGSELTGILLTDGGIFVVYNIGSGHMKWEYGVYSTGGCVAALAVLVFMVMQMVYNETGKYDRERTLIYLNKHRIKLDHVLHFSVLYLIQRNF